MWVLFFLARDRSLGVLLLAEGGGGEGVTGGSLGFFVGDIGVRDNFLFCVGLKWLVGSVGLVGVISGEWFKCIGFSWPGERSNELRLVIRLWVSFWLRDVVGPIWL